MMIPLWWASNLRETAASKVSVLRLTHRDMGTPEAEIHERLALRSEAIGQ